MRDRITTVLAAMAAAFFLFLLLPSLSPHYGFYSDELYYLVCAERLAFGYVDHPPFFPWVLRLHRELFGDSLLALRMLPAAAGALTALLTASMARRMGGGLFAQVLAALALMVSGTSLVMFSWFSVNCLEILLWTTTAWLLLELCRSKEPRLWVALGVVLGISFLTKHTTVLPIAGLAVATMLSPLRRDLLGPWPWVGTLAFASIVSPNLYWQVAHDWASLEYYRGLAVGPFRPLGWLFLTLLVLALAGGQSRPGRIAGAYPVVFAGGATLLEAIRVADAGRLRRAWNTYALPSLMLLAGLVAATLVLPVLPPDLLMNHPLHEGDDWRPQVGPKRLPYHLGNRTHWKALVSEVATVYGGLEPERRDGAVILADYFGHAGAIEYYGGEHALPPVYSPHANYLLWGPPEGSPDPVIAIGIDEALLRANFERVTVAGVFRCAYCPPWQDELPIHVASSPKRSLSEIWGELGKIGGMDRRRRLLRAQESE
jgi:hypothetical protein